MAQKESLMKPGLKCPKIASAFGHNLDALGWTERDGGVRERGHKFGRLLFISPQFSPSSSKSPLLLPQSWGR